MFDQLIMTYFVLLYCIRIFSSFLTRVSVLCWSWSMNFRNCPERFRTFRRPSAGCVCKCKDCDCFLFFFKILGFVITLQKGHKRIVGLN